MMKFLKPAPGRTVHLPDGTEIPAAGMDIEDSLFRRRRLADGDLIEAEPPSAASAPEAEPHDGTETETAEAEAPAKTTKPKGGK
ncbi:DUF2635 domain-containing protein [Rhizobium sp. SL86]|uniref:DUF2635 domain-containing protein n=1 Tax=Rhizobium sp. SL86 TaxID=2995148 RepID=UPI0022743AF9|nr:DUF2635 domain-containing protein [Rhizobium sp. SL86]MCY1668323.1 DUF2635 domain-containing protein [Rhizobium sp. SL86]MCY1669338.1 DUF2635 domain-containing protein [Rhizobium sp. SL86]